MEKEGAFMKWKLYTILFLLTWLDVVTTRIGLLLGLTETNPLATNTWSQTSFEVAVIIKFAPILVLGLVLWLMESLPLYDGKEKVQTTIDGILTFLILFMLGVVINNLCQILLCLRFS